MSLRGYFFEYTGIFMKSCIQMCMDELTVKVDFSSTF